MMYPCGTTSTLDGAIDSSWKFDLIYFPVPVLRLEPPLKSEIMAKRLDATSEVDVPDSREVQGGPGRIGSFERFENHPRRDVARTERRASRSEVARRK